jgi:hypothetical protein
LPSTKIRGSLERRKLAAANKHRSIIAGWREPLRFSALINFLDQASQAGSCRETATPNARVLKLRFSACLVALHRFAFHEHAHAPNHNPKRQRGIKRTKKQRCGRLPMGYMQRRHLPREGRWDSLQLSMMSGLTDPSLTLRVVMKRRKCDVRWRCAEKAQLKKR